MKKAIIGFLTLLLLIGIGLFFSNQQGSVETKNEKVHVKIKNPEVLVDSNKKQQAVAVGAEEKKGNKGEIFVLNLETSVSQEDGVVTYTIRNKSEKEQILQFTTSQRYDYEIYSENGELVNRFSEGKSFLQVLKDLSIAPNDSVTFDIVLPKLDPGQYKLIVWPTAKGTGLLREELQFSIK